MRIVANASAYDTRAVRRVLSAVARMLVRRGYVIRSWAGLRVRLMNGRTQIRSEVVVHPGETRLEALSRSPRQLDLHLPQLRGDEFIDMLRHQHGTESLSVDHGGLTSANLALHMQGTLLDMSDSRVRWQGRMLMEGARTPRGLPVCIPFRIVRPKPPRDRVQDRYARILQLEKVWQRKAKLAATKIKKLRGQRRRYEKQLAARKETT